MILVVLGPTGIGKSKLSISLAKKLNAEIINADATQVYKEVNIGTAKIREEEKEGISHYMIDVVPLNRDYTVRDYQIEARKILDNLISKGKNVIIVGGSYLYLKALLYDYNFSAETENFTYDGISNEELKERVDSIYKDNDIHTNNRKRLVRFLSHYDSTGEVIKNNEGKDKPLYDFKLIGLTAPREKLYEVINSRVEDMLCDGLVEEARELYERGEKRIERFIGYKELCKCFRGEIGVYEAIEEIRQNTRNYAKRQYTFMKNQFKGVKWFQVDFENFQDTIKKVEDYLGL